jgi:hypothetical protein
MPQIRKAADCCWDCRVMWVHMSVNHAFLHFIDSSIHPFFLLQM